MLALLGRKINLGGDIDLQKFFAAGISQHAHQGVVHFDEAALRRAEEQAFLNVVEQFAVTAFGLAAVGDVFEHVNGLQASRREAPCTREVETR